MIKDLYSKYYSKIITTKPVFKKSYLVIILFFTFLITVCILLFFIKNQEHTPSAVDQTSRSIQTRDNAFNQKWRSILNKKDGRQAYEEFKLENANTPLSTQHDMAHLFGMLLYDRYGLEGLSICDDTFTYACYHSLLASVLEEEGLSSLNKLGQVCSNLTDKTLTSGCYHGIGHGVLSFFGYEFKNLNEALDECNGYESANTREWCATGVFMEYNYQLVAGPNRKMRMFDPQNPTFLCDEVLDQFKPSCFFQQTQWWLAVIPGNDSEKVMWIDHICSQRNFEEKKQCYKGLAIHIGMHVRWDPQKAVNLCKVLSANDQQESCLIQSAQEFVYNLKLKKEALQICSELSSNRYNECLQKIE